MRVTLLHLRAAMLEIARTPAFLVPTALFPTMLFLFFGLPNAETAAEAAFIMASFGVFAVMGVCFYQFGVGIAEDRASPWEDFLRTLPATVLQRFAARILSALAVAAVTLLLLFAVATQATPAALSPGAWAALVAALALGGVPFALAGIALGYWLPAKAAVPIANLIYLPLSFLGGIWLPPEMLPQAVEAVSVWLPSRMAGELAWASALARPWPVEALSGLLVYAILALALAHAGYRRHEKRAYA